jgi:hypothetical protein
MLSMKSVPVFFLLAMVASAQIKRAPFATGYMYSYYVLQSASTPWRPALVAGWQGDRVWDVRVFVEDQRLETRPEMMKPLMLRCG